MIEGLVTGVIIAAITILINGAIHRMSVQTRTDRLEKKIEELEQGQKVILKVLLPLVLALKGGKPNGEVEEALRDLNEYLIRK